MATPPPVKRLKPEVRRLEGMQRELYSLLGENTPPVMVSNNKFKGKPSWQQKVTPWRRVPFTNKARDDELELKHWVRGEQDPEAIYRFVHFNTAIDAPEWSDEDYQLFKDDDWSIEETRYLFDLCREYDLRWLVIHDRFDFRPSSTAPSSSPEPAEAAPAEAESPKDSEPEESVKEEDVEMKDADAEIEEPAEATVATEAGEPDAGEPETKGPAEEPKASEAPAEAAETAVAATTEAEVYPDAPKTPGGRTVEDLKERYYEVCSALIRKTSYLSPADEELLEQMKFSKENEQRRKAHLRRLLSRSPAEVAEEEALVLESRRLDALAEQLLQERNDLITLLDSPQTTGSIAQYQTSQGVAQLHQQLLAEKSRKREPADAQSSRKTTPAAPGEQRPSGVAAVTQLMGRRLTNKEEAAFGVTYHDKLNPGVYLRSTKLTTFKQSLTTKAHAIFNELDLPTRPVMPTAKVAAKYDSLVQSVTVLLDAKRVLDKLQMDLKITKTAEQ